MKKNPIKRVIWQNTSTSVVPSDLSKLSLDELDNVCGGGRCNKKPKDKKDNPPSGGCQTVCVTCVGVTLNPVTCQCEGTCVGGTPVPFI